MCTALAFGKENYFFGRNLDVEASYNQSVIITPRNFPFEYAKGHFAFIGAGIISENYPLYFDGTNEKGLSIAALRFRNWAHYFDAYIKKINVPSFDLINYLLSKCESVNECKELLTNINITNENFSESLPYAPLHWLVSDKSCSITVESTIDGLNVYDNTFNLLTNEPPFDFHVKNVNELEFNNLIPPCDNSSSSRFLRMKYIKEYTINCSCREEEIIQFFHMLESVEQQKNSKKQEFTLYTSCCDIEKGDYYYKTYDNPCIRAVKMHKENLNGETLVSYNMLNSFTYSKQN